jgi:hypothetical protein
MRETLCSLFCTFFLLSISWAQTTTTPVTISGYVRETGSQEALIGVSVYLLGTSIGTITNTYGFYSLSVPRQNSAALQVSLVGYETDLHTISLRINTILNVSLTPGQLLSEVEVKAEQTSEKVSERVLMSQIGIPVTQLKKVPAFLGEKDVLKVIQLLPGVQKGSEGQTGIYVRGGGPDQNLISLDDATVYNASHLFGFFSVFNGDALKSVELTKGGFPARYGGRLSSVIELNMKDGNRKKLQGEGGIGLISSRLTLEGPLVKSRKEGGNSLSFLVSGRRTYFDEIVNPLIGALTRRDTQTGYYFYDLNAKINYDLGPQNKVYLSGYFGRDRFRHQDKTSYTNLNWGNATSTLRWNHLFSQKLFSNLSLIFSNYDLQISSHRKSAVDDNTFSLKYGSGIRDLSVKYDLELYQHPRHALRAGLQSIYHQFTPNAVVLKNADINQIRPSVDHIDVVESGVYAEDNWRPTDRLRVNAGVRVSHFRYRRTSYLRPEPRLSLAYMLKPDLAIKTSYALMNQYVHLLSNNGIGLPTDLWVPTTQRVKPQQSQQVGLGLVKDLLEPGLAITVEGYYKTMDNILNYKEGASFLLLNDPTAVNTVGWENNVTAGRGWSYGAEVLLQKKAGRFSGWAGYTLSWTQWQFAKLNGGRPFYPRYDRRHDVSLVGVYNVGKSITLSGTWVYGTGNTLLVPTGRYTTYQPGGSVPYDSKGNLYQGVFLDGYVVDDYRQQKNNFRAQAYHRFDIGVQLRKKHKRYERIWEFSLYNAYNRLNPFFYQLESIKQAPAKPRRLGLFSYSIFPLLPALSYNFRF